MDDFLYGFAANLAFDPAQALRSFNELTPANQASLATLMQEKKHSGITSAAVLKLVTLMKDHSHFNRAVVMSVLNTLSKHPGLHPFIHKHSGLDIIMDIFERLFIIAAKPTKHFTTEHGQILTHSLHSVLTQCSMLLTSLLKHTSDDTEDLKAPFRALIQDILKTQCIESPKEFSAITNYHGYTLLQQYLPPIIEGFSPPTTKKTPSSFASPGLSTVFSRHSTPTTPDPTTPSTPTASPISRSKTRTDLGLLLSPATTAASDGVTL